MHVLMRQPLVDVYQISASDPIATVVTFLFFLSPSLLVPSVPLPPPFSSFFCLWRFFFCLESLLNISEFPDSCLPLLDNHLQGYRLQCNYSYDHQGAVECKGVPLNPGESSAGVQLKQDPGLADPQVSKLLELPKDSTGWWKANTYSSQEIVFWIIFQLDFR